MKKRKVQKNNIVDQLKIKKDVFFLKCHQQEWNAEKDRTNGAILFRIIERRSINGRAEGPTS